MLTKTLSEAKKKQRNILIKAMNNDIGSIDSAKDSWNPAQISERAKDISYIRSLVDSWNPAQLNEALKTLDLPVIDTWNPAQIEEQRRNLAFYLAGRTLTGNPITLNILGNLTPEVTSLKVTMNPIQDLHGQSAPYPAGGGKNQLNLEDTVIAETSVSHVVDILVGQSVVTAVATAGWQQYRSKIQLDTGAYIASVDNVIPSDSSIKWRAVIYDETAGSGVPFAGYDISYKMQDFNIIEGHEYSLMLRLNQVGRAPVGSKVTFTGLMIRLASETDPTFAPYSNICPISGRTEVSVTRTAGEDVETKTHQYSETIYGGVDDFVSGELSNEWGYIASYDGETLPGEWISDRDVYASGTTPTTGAEVCYKLATPTTVETTAEEITLLKGNNVLSTDGDSIELKYKQNF